MGESINFLQFQKFSDKLEAMKFDTNGDGILENDEAKGLNELSLFDAECMKRYGSIKRPGEVSIFPPKETRLDDLPYFREIKELLEPPVIEDKSNDYKKDVNYPAVLTVIKKRAQEKNPNLTEEEMDNIAKMVIEKSQEYNIPEFSPVIAYIMGVECSFVFEKSVLGKDPEFRGTMGVQYDTCCSILERREPRKIRGRMHGSKTNADYSYWHNRHFKQDDTRIDEIKQKYPTPSKLFDAIAKDAELGVEVGIIAFKSNLHWMGGDVIKALHKYGGTYKKIHSLPSIKGLENVPPKVDDYNK